MSTIDIHSQERDIAAVPVIYRLQHLFFAVCTALGPAAILISAFTNPPYFGSEPGIPSAVSTNATFGDLMDQTHLITLVIAAYLLPVTFLSMAWLANRTTPWLASTGALVCMLGFLPLPLYAGQDSLFYDIARWGSSPQFVDLAQRWNSDGVMSLYGVAFGLGSVLGPTLLGIALWRSRAVPVWAAVCVILSRLPVFFFLAVPYRVATAIVLAGTVLLFIGSIPVALAILRGRAGGGGAVEPGKELSDVSA
jgi:hypothetical protein